MSYEIRSFFATYAPTGRRVFLSATTLRIKVPLKVILKRNSYGLLMISRIFFLVSLKSPKERKNRPWTKLTASQEVVTENANLLVHFDDLL